ncbi:MAG TPA: winged helix-turn-helix domain-containing protein, partial [Pyrinomonadaceae bacterium]|nr:winged helix-turn-helix domain-containing protein [Pyrinomonadaceae bacterium]
MEVSSAKRFRFGDFELDGTRRLLLRRGEPVTLNSKTFDLLYALLERHGDILSKDELLEKIWPGQFVEEGNLTVHVSTLRKVFGESKREHRFIVTVPGRGYGFVADLDSEPVAEVTVESHSSSHIVVEEEIKEKTGTDISTKHTRDLRVAYWAAGVVIAVLVVTGVFLLNDLRSRAMVDVPHYTALVFASGGGGIPERVAISPDGKTIAFVDRINGRSSMRLGEADSFNSVEIIPAADRFYHFVSFSPDGQKVYFTVREDKRRLPTLMRVSILGGQVHELIYDLNSFFTFSPDGKSIAFMRRDGEEGKVSIVAADADTGKNERVLLTRERPENISGSGLSWSPDGKLIAFAEAAGGPRFRLATLNVETGDVQKISEPAEGRIVNLVWLRDGSGLA